MPLLPSIQVLRPLPLPPGWRLLGSENVKKTANFRAEGGKAAGERRGGWWETQIERARRQPACRGQWEGRQAVAGLWYSCACCSIIAHELQNAHLDAAMGGRR